MSKDKAKDGLGESFPNSAFNRLNQVDVSERTENKNGLTYLSWAWAFAEVFKRFPNTVMKVIEYENVYFHETETGVITYTKKEPWCFNPKLGYLIKTEVTVDGITREMHLPVMDGANKAQKDVPYTYKGWEYVTVPNQARKTKKAVDKLVEPATMFDINTTIMRCLTKNFAVHGLGLYIYAGEDLPEDIADMIRDVVATTTPEVAQVPATPEESTPVDKPTTATTTVADKPVRKARTTKAKVEKPEVGGEMPDDSIGAGQPFAESEKAAKAAVGTSLEQRILAAKTHEEAFKVLDELNEAKVLATGTLHFNWKFKSLADAKTLMSTAPFDAVQARLVGVVNHYNPN